MNEVHSSVQKTLHHLNTILNSPGTRSGDRLPSINSLARSVKVSTAFVCLAVKILQQQGRLTVTRRRGITAGTSAQSAEPKCRPARWEQVRSRIEADILAGTFVDSLLPSIRSLQQHYGSSRPTITRAIRAMVADRLLVPHGARYRIHVATQPATHASILFIGPGYAHGQMVFVNDRFRELFRVVQAGCIQNRMVLNESGVHSAHPAGIARILDQKHHHGYVVWLGGIEPEVAQRIISVLSTLRRPLVLIDEGQDYTVPPSIRALPMVRLFRIAGRLAGEDMGRFLIGQGHACASYITTDSTQPWSRLRYDGLLRAFQSVKTSSSLNISDNPVSCHVCNSSTVAALPVEKSISSAMGRFLKTLDNHPLRHSLRYATSHFVYLPTVVQELAQITAIQTALAPILDTILCDKKTTAIVAENDALATHIIDYVQSKGLRPGRDLSIAGFDDSEMACHYDLSSYDFMFDRMAREIVGFIIHPRHDHFCAADNVIECVGAVVNRASTAGIGHL